MLITRRAAVVRAARPGSAVTRAATTGRAALGAAVVRPIRGAPMRAAAAARAPIRAVAAAGAPRARARAVRVPREGDYALEEAIIQHTLTAVVVYNPANIHYRCVREREATFERIADMATLQFGVLLTGLAIKELWYSYRRTWNRKQQDLHEKLRRSLLNWSLKTLIILREMHFIIDFARPASGLSNINSLSRCKRAILHKIAA
ncbi:hypothetical protein QAD02_020442 [Eretmocerus hayati]|uniref:Uncharacterized protein n=1 Tax=Eretmocerus hayati TaxID=131215 RepID=A0ACC2PPX8_9HYME|nr:hypothetical protein QAD02_020442 [Eretmocerus hayati]